MSLITYLLYSTVKRQTSENWHKESDGFPSAVSAVVGEETTSPGDWLDSVIWHWRLVEQTATSPQRFLP